MQAYGRRLHFTQILWLQTIGLYYTIRVDQVETDNLAISWA